MTNETPKASKKLPVQISGGSGGQFSLLCGARPAYPAAVKRFWNVCLILSGVLLFGVLTAGAALRPVENRYLFILETSKEMKREAEPAKNVLLRLIYTGVMGQMKAGDTIGVWTYNDALHAGDIPMQTFTTEDRESVTHRVGEYLTNQKFTGGAHLELALLPMLKLATNSPNLTVILISDGKQAVAGTPFDAEIRALHKKYYDELREAKLPFITALVANKGEFISYAVSSALGPIRVPRLPKPPAPTNAVPVVTAPKAPEVKVGPSLYLRGALPKNTTTTETPPPAAPADTAKPAAVETAPSNAVATTKPETVVSQTTEVAQVVPPAPTAVVEPVKQPVEQSKPVEQPKAPEPIEKSEPVPTKEKVSNVTTFTVQETNAAATAHPAPPSEPKEQAKETVSTPPAPSPASTPTETPVVEKKPSAPQPVVVAQTEGSNNLRNVLIVIGTLLFLILIVLVLMLRKSKHAHPSLITQSIDKSGP